MTGLQADRRMPGMGIAEVQAGNTAWWTANTMSYDWKDKVSKERFSPAWFDEIDRRFIHGARLFAHGAQPFDQIIPFADLAGKRVLEIGCGMGLHTELMTRAGASVTAVDISPTSIEATSRRLKLKGLEASVYLADAESLQGRASFDFIWSWGVIHHSSRTGRIVRNIAHLLTPDGSCRVMVYNRGGITVPVVYVKDHLLRGRFFRQDFDTTLSTSWDGFTARFYTADQLGDLFRTFFDEVRVSVCGQDADALPLPSRLRRPVLKLVSADWLKRRQATHGAFLFVEASRVN
jgi:2-polyprenyl-3-methyl-5-hydroxy-6-metoxy-1,4-benzoquinol methylase